MNYSIKTLLLMKKMKIMFLKNVRLNIKVILAELKKLEKEEKIVPKANLGKVEAIWAKLKNKHNVDNVPKNAKESIENQDLQNDTTLIENKDKDEIIEEQIQKGLEKLKEMNKKEVVETVQFAGQKFDYKKQINEEEMEKLKKKQTHRGLDSLIDQISRKNNLNTYGKTKRDWDKYVETKKIEKELENNRKDG
jgi:hypothetical protein